MRQFKKNKVLIVYLLLGEDEVFTGAFTFDVRNINVASVTSAALNANYRVRYLLLFLFLFFIIFYLLTLLKRDPKLLKHGDSKSTIPLQVLTLLLETTLAFLQAGFGRMLSYLLLFIFEYIFNYFIVVIWDSMYQALSPLMRAAQDSSPSVINPSLPVTTLFLISSSFPSLHPPILPLLLPPLPLLLLPLPPLQLQLLPPPLLLPLLLLLLLLLVRMVAFALPTRFGLPALELLSTFSMRALLITPGTSKLTVSSILLFLLYFNIFRSLMF